MRTVIAFIFVMWICITSYAQKSKSKTGMFNGFKKSKARIGFDKKQREFYISPEKRGNWKQLNIEFRADDSVSVYFNDSLIYSKKINHSEMPYASYDAYIPFKVQKLDSKNYLTIVLNKRGEYVRFKVYEKYGYIDAYFADQEKAIHWTIVHENNMPR